MARKAVSLAILSITYSSGITAIITGQIISSFTGLLPNAYYTNKLIDYPAREQLQDYLPSLLASLFMGTCLWLAQQWATLPLLFEVLVLAVSGAALYLVITWKTAPEVTVDFKAAISSHKTGDSY